ncbi:MULTISPECIES: GNAT family N-acetyltransferase [Halomicrobium]|uniref:GCN5-related N-acetyltransferase n=2 Tax=Halomicrobium mukohataei TaxID=57705 RepID=C7NWM8_HALMD|nr:MULTISPECIES: GNAT family N-acetyltransferase [Halomicrobium]ACV48238.1 GCN5-related N-acetyltransferase [Halomicrobium mukohataei DSM 12286]QCD66658.1 GNAT family N-acetyltransferase [Halomicrobium mukohataei]QFR21464.1 GNAT family N-acetyltransferase [Halomicrobium sp. ZPS1]
METVERPTFESDTSRRIYEYVERHGTAKRHILLEQSDASAEEFGDRLDELKERGYLSEDGGTIRVALDVGAVEAYETGDLSVTIRPARHEDFDGLVRAIRDVTDEETYVVAETVAEELLYEDTINRHTTVESRVFFVAAIDGEVVGWTHLDLPQLDSLAGTAQQTVGVTTEYRGEGIGSELLRRGLSWAEANGYRKVYNSLPMTNDRAIEFLTDHGWNTEAIRRNHYTIDDEQVDEVMLSTTI